MFWQFLVSFPRCDFPKDQKVVTLSALSSQILVPCPTTLDGGMALLLPHISRHPNSKSILSRHPSCAPQGLGVCDSIYQVHPNLWNISFVPTLISFVSVWVTPEINPNLFFS